MAIIVNDNLQNNSPKALDNKYLKNGMTAYTSVSDVNTTIVSAYRSRGLTVCINVSGTLTEYWYKSGIADGDLVVKDAYVPLTRLISTNSTINGGGALSSDLTLSVVDNTSNQKVGVFYNSNTPVIGTRKSVNFIPGTNVTLSVVDDGVNDWVSVTINASGGGGGGDTFNSHVANIVSDTTTFTYAGIVGATKIPPYIMVYPTVFKFQSTDNTPAVGEIYVNLATGDFISGSLLSAGQDVGITWYT